MSESLRIRGVPAARTHFATRTLVDARHPARAEVEAYIAHIYLQRYGAVLRSFLPHLMVYRDACGAIRAAVGLRRGGEGDFFVEQYLDTSAEQAIGHFTGRAPSRRELVEVGNFASASAGDARELILQLTASLHAEGLRWVLFAATRQLRNAFDRLHLSTIELADARSECLADDHSDWGSYYEAQPKVMFGDIAAGHAYLARMAAASVADDVTVPAFGFRMAVAT